MAWVRTEDGVAEHRKFLRLAELANMGDRGAAAAWLWHCGLGYCNRQPARDGVIPAIKVAALFPLKSATACAEMLVTVGLWERVEGGYLVHDYHHYQPTAEKAAEVATKRIAAGRIGGQRSADVRRAASEANGKQSASGVLEAKEQQTGKQSASSKMNPRPDPTRPDPKDAPLGPPGGALAGGLALVPDPPPAARRAARAVAPPDPAAAEVLAELNAARQRAIPGARTLSPTPENLRHIAERLAAGASLDDCRHVVAVCEAECRSDAKARDWFDAVSPFRPDNFARKLGRTTDAVPAASLGSRGAFVPRANHAATIVPGEQ